MVWSLFPEIERVNIPQRRTISAIEEADSVAADTRKRWNLGSDALENVTQTLETHGAMVVHYNQQSTARFDGLSALVNKRWPMLIVNSNVTADRLRFDLAHELGHILMDTSSLGDEKAQEFAAHRFASSFLIPGSVLKNEIGIKRQNLSLSELLLLKEKYGVSVGALLYASRAHGIVTDSLYTSLQKQLSARGWRKLEPAVFGGNEQPARMRQLVTRAVAENLMGVREAALLFPDMAAELHREFPHVEGPAEKLRKMPKKERDAILLKAAEAAAIEYATNPDLIVGDADGYYEYN